MYGDYGVTVNTEVCGTFDLGSIPSSPPKKEIFLCIKKSPASRVSRLEGNL